MMHFILQAAASAGMSAVLTWCLVRWSSRLRLVAQPRPDRWHQKVKPNTGGIAVAIACAICFSMFAGPTYGLIAACAGGIALFGFIDDRAELPPLVKLVGQVVAAALVAASGITLQLTPWPWTDAAVTILWIVGLTNAFNLIDNMDGLCAGVTIAVATSVASLALMEHDGARSLLLSVIAGASLGFLIFNHQPARIFLGDCGSMFLGFSLAALSVPHPASGGTEAAIESLYPIPAFFYPMFDVALVSCLRHSAGKPIMTGGRDHSSHLLVSMGLRERTAVWLLWICAALCAASGPLSYGHPSWLIATAAFLVSSFVIFGIALARVPRSASPFLKNYLVRGAAYQSEERSALH